VNPEPEARRLKRAAPRRRTIAAIAVGALAIGGLAVLPITGALAGVNDVVFSVATGASVPPVVVTAYPVDATGIPVPGGTVKTLTGSAANPSVLSTAAGAGATTLTAATRYKFKMTAAGFQSRWLVGTSATAANVQTLTTTAGNSFTGATLFLNALGTDEFNFGSQTMVAAGATASTVAVTSVLPINNDGTVGTGDPAVGQKARVTVTVTAPSQSPTGFVTLDGGTTFTADGSQTAVLSGGTATFDAIVTAAAGSTASIIVSYSGDANVVPGTVTKSNQSVAGGAGTLSGQTTGAGATAGVTVTAYTNPVTGTPVVASSATTDATGNWRLTLPNSPTEGYKLRYSKAGLIPEWELTAAGANNGLYSFATGGNLVLNSTAPTAIAEQLDAVGATAPVISVATSPSQPRVGQVVTYTVTVTGAASVGAVNFSDGTAAAAAAVNGSGVGVLTRTYTTTGLQSSTITWSGDGTRAAGSQGVTVNVEPGGLITGTVSNAGGVVNGATVGIYDANTGAQVGVNQTTAGGGIYELAVPDGNYKARFFAAGHIAEWNLDKPTFAEGTSVSVAGGAATVNATLVAWGATATPTATAVLTPTTPVVGQPFTAVVTMNPATATGTIVVALPTALGQNTAVKLDAAGKATVTFPALAAGAGQNLIVTYSGDTTFIGGNITVATVTPVAATQTVITSSIPTSRSGVDPLIKATVRDSAGALVTGAGVVTFKKGTTTIGSVATATGVAALSGALTIGTAGITEGANVITAEYAGAAGFAPSTSATFNQTVVKNQGRLTTVSPFRVLQPTAVASATSRDITFTSIPTNAVAVQLNVTASGVNANTFLSVCPGGTPLATCKLTSNVNSAGPDTRNFAIVALGGAGTDTVTVYNNAGSTLVSADVYGWVIDAAGTDGSLSVYSPARFGDAIPFGPESVSTVTFDDVPAGATAIALNVTVAGVTGNTFISACPVTATTTVCKEKSIINSNGRDMANFVIVPLSGPQGNKVKFYNNAGIVSQLLLDVAGYVVGTPSAVSNGRFQAVAPVRAIAPTTVPAGTFANVTLTGVPAGATAVAINLTAAGVNANTYYSICPGNMPDATCKITSVLNSAGPDTAGFVIVQLGSGNTLKIYNNAGSPLAIGDVTGWVIG